MRMIGGEVDGVLEGVCGGLNVGASVVDMPCLRGGAAQIGFADTKEVPRVMVIGGKTHGLAGQRRGGGIPTE